jgi:hypothetical protein
MPRDYMLEMVEEFGRTLRAVIDLKNENPVKAIEMIATAFNGTKFTSKTFFDKLTVEELSGFLEKNSIDYKSLDMLIDLLFEEIDITSDKLLIDKVDYLVTYTTQKEREQRIFSLKRSYQKQNLAHIKNTPI